MNIDLFADSVEKQGAIGRLNAGVKLLATLLMTLALILVKDWVSAGSILLLELIALRAVGVHPLRLLGRFWPVLFGALLSGWSTALLVEKTGRVVLEIGFLLVTTDSLATGFALMLRGLAMVLPGLLLIATSDPTDIADSLAQTAKLPARFVLAALAALRLVGLMFTEWNALGQARRARGLGGRDNPWQTLKTVGGQTFALLVQAIRRGTRLSTTMEARGFGGPEPRTWARQVTYSRGDLFFFLGCLLLIAAGYSISAAAGELTFLWQ
ncbi:energy-coupling factor transporter transmembrane component T family protein [Rothia aerolata]|uniref:ABC transporter n=1 Tax=Rothia aerolata TaxID=1812262 RepID=A0A917ITN3_9MICC|nr:energy-coupling factor transporter transmembrane component T [Rothia aerolata]GGH62427.1 ABC transporter [Rothia aerolata]